MLSESRQDFTIHRGADQAKAPVSAWQAGHFRFDMMADAPVWVMGIVNVTPDSFSDGGQHIGLQDALNHAERLILEGADILDIGGESTRPGAPEVSIEQELSRVLPVVQVLADKGYCVSIDTRKPEVMRAAIAAGASVVNDVMALTAPGALETCATSKVGVVLMHMRGSPQTMQVEPQYDDVVREVGDFLVDRAQACETAGIGREGIVLDPGFGFGKTLEHNLMLTQHLRDLVARGYPVLAGWSRKGTIGKLTGRTIASERVHGSVAAALACAAHGARVVRVHDVAPTVDALKVWRAMTLKRQSAG